MKVQRKVGAGASVLKSAVDGLKGLSGKVGFFETAKYEDGTPVAYVATIQEFGVPEKGIPSRSFMRSTIGERQGAWRGLTRQGSQAVFEGKSNGSDVMEALGLLSAGDIRKKISEISSPALKSSTIAARRRGKADKKTVGNLTKPLVDTGLMLQSVSHVVEKK